MTPEQKDLALGALLLEGVASIALGALVSAVTRAPLTRTIPAVFVGLLGRALVVNAVAAAEAEGEYEEEAEGMSLEDFIIDLFGDGGEGVGA